MGKKFSVLHNRLMNLLDREHELFMEERSFLHDGADPVITELEEATQNQMEIRLTVKEIQSVIRKSLAPVIPPKQEKLI